MAHPKVLAFILAGGKGERLFPLTAFRSKPSVPFGGRYRIVDFVLSNLVNSHIFSLYLLVQYKSQSLIEHVRQHWNLSSVVKDHFVAVVPPQMRMGLNGSRVRPMPFFRMWISFINTTRSLSSFLAPTISTEWTSGRCWIFILREKPL